MRSEDENQRKKTAIIIPVSSFETPAIGTGDEMGLVNPRFNLERPAHVQGAYRRQ